VLYATGKYHYIYKTMKITNYLLLSTLLFISCSGQNKWKPYTDEKGKLQIAFKDNPKVKTESQQFQFGAINWTIASIDTSQDDNLSYSIKYADFPTNIITSDSIQTLQQFFIFTQSDLIQSLGQESAENINIKQLQGYPGREFRWVDKSNNIGYTRRVFLVSNRVYFLEVKYKISNDHNNDIWGFLDKFSLLNTSNNLNSETALEKPEKKFEIDFPGITKITDNQTYTALWGNTYVILEAYETPKNEIDLTTTKNIMYGVNYAKLPADKLKTLTKQQIKDFVTAAFTDNIKNSNGKIIFQKDVSVNGNWGIEAEGTLIDNSVVMHLKGFVIKDYYYQIIVLSKNGHQDNKEAEDFINSFKLKE